MSGKIFKATFMISVLGLLPILASVRASVDENPVISGESVELSIEAKGEHVKFPKIEKIGNIPVTEEGSQRFEHFENNRTVVEWVKLYAFTPERSITIPSYAVVVDGKTKKTSPIFLQVKNGGGADIKKDFRLEIESDKKEAYVAEAVRVVARFYEKKSAPVMNVEFLPIHYENFWVKRIGGEKRYVKNGYLVHEIHYLFFPQKAGKLVVEPVSVKVAVAKKMRDAFGFIVRRPIWFTLKSESIPLQVKPLPPDINLVGHFKIGAEAHPRSVLAGEPVELHVRVNGEGNIEDYDPLELKIKGVTVYADKPKLSQKYSHGIYRGKWEMNYVLIAQKPFTIPPFTLRYLDPSSGEVRTLETSPIEIEVKGATQKDIPVKDSKSKIGSPEPKIDFVKNSWLMLAFVFGMGTMYGAVSLARFLGRKQKKRPKKIIKEKEMLQRVLPYVHRCPDAAIMAENLYAKIYEGKPVKIDIKKFESLMSKIDGC
ncbi:BatD family protein [Hydrogenimonas sp.]